MATQAQLTEARAAYHTLMTRGGIVKMRHYEREMVYKAPDAAQLLAYVNSLEAQLGVPTDQRTGLRRTRGRRVMFG